MHNNQDFLVASTILWVNTTILLGGLYESIQESNTFWRWRALFKWRNLEAAKLQAIEEGWFSGYGTPLLKGEVSFRRTLIPMLLSFVFALFAGLFVLALSTLVLWSWILTG